MMTHAAVTHSTIGSNRFGLFEKRKATLVVPHFKYNQHPLTQGQLLQLVANHPKNSFVQIAEREFGWAQTASACWGYTEGDAPGKYGSVFTHDGVLALQSALEQLKKWRWVDSLQPNAPLFNQNLRITDKGKNVLSAIA